VTKYKIKIFYQTGDTSGHKDTEDYLDGTWINKKILKENLGRIKEHYKWLKNKYDDYSDIIIDEPEWHVDLPEYSVKLKLCSAFWAGYFETLYGACVEIEKEDKLEFWL
jgi:hypothetical protein